MPELTTDDVEQYTGGRLDANDDETERMLAAALAAARNYCGWHVTPVIEDEEIIVNGSGEAALALPTMKLVELTEVIEDDVELDVAELVWSTGRTMRKRSGAWWTWKYGGVAVTWTHGFEDAPDFNEAVLSMLDRASRGGGGSGSGVAREKAGVYEISYQSVGSVSAFTATENLKLDAYRIQPET